MAILQRRPGGLLLRVKAVPGASRDALAGALGDRLKVRVAAPPEGGRANEAICDLVAAALGVRRRSVQVTGGAASAEKSIFVASAELDPDEALRRLGC